MMSDAWLLRSLVVNYGRATPMRLLRTLERARADGRETLCFALMIRGGWDGQFGDRRVEIGPGQVCVVDFAQLWSAEAGETEYVFVVAARAALQSLLPNTGGLHGRLIEGTAGRVVADHFLALVRFLRENDRADIDFLESTTLRLLAAAGCTMPPSIEMSAEADPVGAQRARVASYIEEHLFDPGLGAYSLCRNLGVSRPTLYRMFSHSGGVASHIRRRRLEAAHVLLARTDEKRPLSEIAEDFGFSSHAHFTTAFRRQFGYAPRDARGRNRKEPLETISLFKDWQLRLDAFAQDRCRAGD